MLKSTGAIGSPVSGLAQTCLAILDSKATNFQIYFYTLQYWFNKVLQLNF